MHKESHSKNKKGSRCTQANSIRPQREIHKRHREKENTRKHNDNTSILTPRQKHVKKLYVWTNSKERNIEIPSVVPGKIDITL